MGLVNIDTKELADEAAKMIVPALQPVLEAAVTKLIAELKTSLIGRKVTITIE